MRLVIIPLAMLMCFISETKSLACTAFCLNNGNHILLAKNLDWNIDLGYALMNMRGIQKISFTDNCKTISWTSKYRSITFNQFGKEFPLSGMNEKGLVIEELNSSYVGITSDTSKSCINEFQIVQYLLDNCQTTDEVVAHLENLQYKPLLFSLHYLIADKNGKSIIVEYDGNNFLYFSPESTGYPILSNNNYTESVKYLKNFIGFGGNKPVMNRPGSNERFVSVANMLANYKTEPPVDYSFRILDAVKQNDTRWSIVYDISDLKIYFRFHSCNAMKTIDLKKIFDSDSYQNNGCDITDCSFIGVNGFHSISKKDNSQLIQNVFNLLSLEVKLNEKTDVFNRMAAYGNQYLK